MKTLLSLIITVLFFSNQLSAQTDKTLMSEAKSAIEKTKDFNQAIEVLNKVSAEGKQDPDYSYNKAQAYEGLNNYLAAAFYYETYAKRTSLTSEIMDKIKDLRLSARKGYKEKSEEEKTTTEKNGVEEIEKIIAFEKEEEYKYYQAIPDMQVSSGTKRKLLVEFAKTSQYYSEEATSKAKTYSNTRAKNTAARNSIITSVLVTTTLLLINILR